MEPQTIEQYFGKGRRPSFDASPRYFKDGDYVAYFFDNSLFYAQRIDEWVTVYRSERTGEMVGCKIKSVSHLIKTLGNFAVEITDNKIKLGLLFLTFANCAESSKREQYMEIARRVGKENVDLSALTLAA